ncbi:IPT/TIG domain-containing protein, partial [Candidatus Pacearchaeota archaeon]|nr:IPT/TIG domain-containing protein [Candidatus Pacearchaeota archaeon]
MSESKSQGWRALRIAVGIAVLAVLLLVGGGTAAIPQPIITSITQTAGVAGMAITINGQNFGTNPTVLFGDTSANLQHPNGYFKRSDTQIVAQVPTGIGTVQVKVKTSNEESNGMTFTYLDIPIVSQWRWPRDEATPINGWGYDIYSSKDGGNHTGIDIWEEKNKIDTSVFAAADGIVVAKCPYGEKCIGFSTNYHNHRLYSVVIIAHRLSKETLVYSMYADMANDLSSTPEPGERVYMGKTILGQTGRYIQYLDDDGKRKERWISHVHFEIKTKPVLHNPDWPAHPPIWGYTNKGKNFNPDNYGYKNPGIFINVPIRLSPTNGIKDVTMPLTLSWSAVSEAQYYGIQISRNKDFTDIVYDKTDLTTTSVVIPELTLNTPYWWRVDAKIVGENWPWSNVHSFTKVTMDESSKSTGGILDRLEKAIKGVEEYFTSTAQKVKEVVKEYISIPEKYSAPLTSTITPTQTKTTTPTLTPVITPTLAPESKIINIETNWGFANENDYNDIILEEIDEVWGDTQPPLSPLIVKAMI